MSLDRQTYQESLIRQFGWKLRTIVCLALWSAGVTCGAGPAPDTSGNRSEPKGTPSQPERIDEEADDDNAPYDDDLPDADAAASAMAVPDGSFARAKPIDRAKFTQELRQLLKEGLADAAKGPVAAKQRAEAARQIVPDEPRIPYACGVVLVGHRQHKDATDEFRTAIRQSKAPFLPAMQALAWTNVELKNLVKGAEAALELARRIEDTKGLWPTASDRERAAEWLGRFFGYLTGPGRKTESGSQIERIEADVQKLLTDERKAAYARGKKGVARRHEELTAWAARPQQEIFAEAKRERQQVVDEAAAAEKETARLESEMQKIKRPHDEVLSGVDRDIKTAHSKLTAFQKDIGNLTAFAENLSVPRVYDKVSGSVVNVDGHRIARLKATMRTETPKERGAGLEENPRAGKRAAERQSTGVWPAREAQQRNDGIAT